MLVRPAARVYRTWIVDSRRWDHYRPRPGDIVIATYPKCGTTWMQRIVGLLVFQTPEPRPVMQISPWIDRRFPEPVEAVMARIEAQDHRRFLKAHLPARRPADLRRGQVRPRRAGRARRLHVLPQPRLGLHARDAGAGSTGPAWRTSRSGRPYPRIPADPAEHFHRWLTEGAVPGHGDGSPAMSFFHFERTWWDERHRPNVLLVHYNDLKADLSGEMRRVADFLGISVPPDIWPELVEAAGFEAMRRDWRGADGERGDHLPGRRHPLLPRGHERALAWRLSGGGPRPLRRQGRSRAPARVRALGGAWRPVERRSWPASR